MPNGKQPELLIQSSKTRGQKKAAKTKQKARTDDEDVLAIGYPGSLESLSDFVSGLVGQCLADVRLTLVITVPLIELMSESDLAVELETALDTAREHGSVAIDSIELVRAKQ